MDERNLSPMAMFARLAEEHRPIFAFASQTARDAAAWKKQALPAVLATLGNRPERVPPNPELVAEWEHDGLVKQRWLIDVGRHIAASLLVNRPKALAADERRPAILCWHGHGAFGKEPVMGNDSSAALRAEIDDHRYNYGHQMAKFGFVTFAIDWMGKGDRDDSQKPHHLNQAGGREGDAQEWRHGFAVHGGGRSWGSTARSREPGAGRTTCCSPATPSRDWSAAASRSPPSATNGRRSRWSASRASIS